MNSSQLKAKRKNIFVRRLINAVAHLFNIPIIATYDPMEDRDALYNEAIAGENKYMIDFRPDRLTSFSGITISNSVFTNGVQGTGVPLGGSAAETPKPVIKIAVKPKDVLHELERMPTKFSLEGLDDKIGMMQDKIRLITQAQTRKEAEVLLEMLTNRKKYYDKAADGQIFWQYFAQFDSTHDGNIKKLLDKYKLVMEPADIFIPELPKDASDVMTQYTVKFEELTKKLPRLFVIANEESFKKVYAKRDPILLAQSPFGFYYHILGAWDQEMLYLPEL
jgi:hypothetical protein